MSTGAASWKRLPILRGTRVGLRDPQQVDRLKVLMRAGEFRYEEPRGQIGGVRDPWSVYHVIEGHHRIVAALELFHETGDPNPVEQLLRWGLWTAVEGPPPDSRPLPARNWWGWLRNRIGI